MAQRGADLLQTQVLHVDSVHGGDLSQVVRLTLTDGREAAVKGGPDPRAEAAMLIAIGATGARAPAVLGVDDDVLVIEWLPDSVPINAAWSDLGFALATLHRARASRYGWDGDYAFGPVAIENAWSDSWSDFWAEHRLLAHCEYVSAALRQRIERLAGDLDGRLPSRPHASLLHGDLWTGNVLARGERVTGLIDPACYYGHGEVDVAMLSLFAKPSNEFYDSYDELEPGHGDRIVIYQLWPALVHLRLFGRAYLPLVDRLLSAAGF